jgi:wobble nucleotide-excising tRNase
MLQEIKISDEATYSTEGERLHDLKEINFIFGTNGAGKTTISRIIANPVAYSTCAINWRLGQPIECLVYNRDFIEDNFRPQMSGIFTLGKTEGDTLVRIAEAQDKVSKFEQDIGQLETTLGPIDGSFGKRLELKNLRTAFEVECWKILKTHEDQFKMAFAGVRDAKAKFCDKLLSESSSNSAELSTLNELTEKAKTAFDDGLEKLTTIPPVDAADLISVETTAALTKKVVGKDDVDVAALIKRLGNSDWVRQGLDYLTPDEPCPFCQQTVEADLAKKLNDYFDETFLNDMSEITNALESFDVHAAEVVRRYEETLTLASRYIDSEKMRSGLDRLIARIEVNKRLLQGKKKEPSTPVTLEGLAPLVTPLADQIAAANIKIAEHNALVDNIVTERNTLISRVWKFILEENSALIAKYFADRLDLAKAEQSMSAALSSKKAQHEATRAELRELEKSVTSVQPTVTAINRLLASFGFSGFKLQMTGEQSHLYQIVRDDGSEACSTLSEGERSFISFLYFFHLLRGSKSASGVTNDRVVVFDDPVSSLDSDVLFVVGSLIKKTLKEACEGQGQIKQVFVLTHNIYFHKEVSFDKNRSQDVCKKHETFWTVRKINGVSTLVKHPNNPIKTSYELLWQEIRGPNQSNLTIQNTMRRIIENYFRILGNISTDDITGEFDGQDQQICASLFSWVNDGSHSAHDDLFISMDDGMIARYVDVFRRIFVQSGHEAHYHMMMRTEPEVLATSSATPIALAGAA